MDIQRELQGYETAQLREYGIFEENVKGVRDTETPPPPLNGASLFGDLLKREKKASRCGRGGERVSFISPFWFVKLPFVWKDCFSLFLGGGVGGFGNLPFRTPGEEREFEGMQR